MGNVELKGMMSITLYALIKYRTAHTVGLVVYILVYEHNFKKN